MSISQQQETKEEFYEPCEQYSDTGTFSASTHQTQSLQVPTEPIISFAFASTEGVKRYPTPNFLMCPFCSGEYQVSQILQHVKRCHRRLPDRPPPKEITSEKTLLRQHFLLYDFLSFFLSSIFILLYFMQNSLHQGFLRRNL